MKIGLILECIEGGADELICTHFIKLLLPRAEIRVAPLGNKPNLIDGCGQWTQKLLQDGCNHVVIVWDLYPAWKSEQKPDREQDRQAIQKALREAKIDISRHPVSMVCITHELEAWLIADRSALVAAFSPRIKADRIKYVRHPDRESSPKDILTRYFKQTNGTIYNGSKRQIEYLLRHLTDIPRLQRVCSFDRFIKKVTQSP